MINIKSKIYIAGHSGLVGSAIYRKLKSNGFKKLFVKSRRDLDLNDQKKVLSYLKRIKPNFIFIAAAKVGGVYANNTLKAEFIYNNLNIQNNLIHSAYLAGIKNLIFLGSSCIYSLNAKQPMKEKDILCGPLEKTNEPYAIAKIAGIKMCESYNYQYGTNYRCLMPTNTFGQNDKYDTLNSHFIPSLIKKIYEIEKKNKNEITLWGDGTPKREIIYVDDIADACIYFMNKKTSHSLINIGTGKEDTIKGIAQLFLKTLIPEKKIQIKFDKSKPNGIKRKVLDTSLAKRYGWTAKNEIKKAIIDTYINFKLLKANSK